MPNFLGIDYGEKRVGLAFGDELALATPLPAAIQTTEPERLAQIAALVKQRRIHEVVIGYPYNMDGSAGFKAKEVDAFIEKLAPLLGDMPIHRSDERLTSHQAGLEMAVGKKRSNRSPARTPRAAQAARRTGELDSRAAALILQDFLSARFPPAIPEPDDFYDE